mmetsp:Transcript_50873/g.121652  ORF Transcript_50873/g.121652 Transcript_50873/m.121652 type:complete len:204 (-) Transcript_50873:569-1180(-)
MGDLEDFLCQTLVLEDRAHLASDYQVHSMQRDLQAHIKFHLVSRASQMHRRRRRGCCRCKDSNGKNAGEGCRAAKEPEVLAFAVGEADENLVLRVPQQRRRLRKCYTKSAYARVAQDICLQQSLSGTEVEGAALGEHLLAAVMEECGLGLFIIAFRLKIGLEILDHRLREVCDVPYLTLVVAWFLAFRGSAVDYVLQALKPRN